MSKQWIISLEEDSETGDLILPLSDDILEDAGWKQATQLNGLTIRMGLGLCVRKKNHNGFLLKRFLCFVNATW